MKASLSACSLAEQCECRSSGQLLPFWES